MPKLSYKVTADDRVAKFSSYCDAIDWARTISRVDGVFAEVSDASGLIAQFDKGQMTPEFRRISKS